MIEDSMNECYDISGMIKCLNKGIDLIHEILKECAVSEDLRFKLAKWRDDANGMIP